MSEDRPPTNPDQAPLAEAPQEPPRDAPAASSAPTPDAPAQEAMDAPPLLAPAPSANQTPEASPALQAATSAHAPTAPLLGGRRLMAAIGSLAAVLVAFVLTSSLNLVGSGSLGAIVDPSGRVVSRLHAEGVGRGLAYGMGDRMRRRTGARQIQGPPEGVRYQVQSGGTLQDIARIFDMPLEDLKAINADAPEDRFFGPGAWVYVYKPGLGLATIKPGTPDALYHAVPLQDGPGRKIRRRSRSWGTPYLVANLDYALRRYGEAYPQGPAIIVSDMSRREGGRLPPHHTHREGRDVDLSYVPKPDQDNGGFLMMNEWAFDVERNWTFLKALLDTGSVEVILMDRLLQELLYKHLKAQGTPDQELARLFQYPRGTAQEVGIIRHWEGHRDHVHIRFACAPEDQYCR